MKAKALIILIALFASTAMFSQNKRNTYLGEWKKAEEYSKQSLPKSAIKEVENILQLATKEKNIPQIMRAYTELRNLNAQIDSDRNNNYISKLEELLQENPSPTDQALIHSILADQYMDHYLEDKWNIDSRTNLADDIIPNDINEWTSATYLNKIVEHLNLAVRDKEALKKDTSKSYEDIIDLGNDSRTYQPTLYDFVMSRTIETAQKIRRIGNQRYNLDQTGVTLEQIALPAKDFVKLHLTSQKEYIIFNYYQQYFSDLLGRKLTGSIILLELNKLNYLKYWPTEFDSAKRLEILYRFEKLYNADETSIEIINYIVYELSENSYHYYAIFRESTKNKKQENTNKEIYDWLQKGIKKHPNYKRISILKNKLLQLQSPKMRVQGKTLFYSSDTITLDVILKNPQLVKKAKTISLFRIDGKTEKLIKTYPANYSSNTTYDQDTVKLNLGTLPFGKYFIQGNYDNRKNKDEKLEFIVSDLMTYYRNSAQGEYEIFVVNRKNGEPIKGAKTFFTDEKGEKGITFSTTKELGMTTFYDPEAARKQYYNSGKYFVINGKDDALPPVSLYGSSYNYRQYSPNTEEQNKNTISLFSDRSIYRPGQTVYFKAIVIDKDSKTVNNSKQTIRLYNPNNEIVSEKTLTTNEYGSIADNFVLPQGGLSGYYNIQIDNTNSLYFRVEEYKRPTFEIKFDKVDRTYRFGEKVTLKGNAKTYSGISLQGANVDYRISRRPFSFWPWIRNNESHMADGSVKTKDDGTFEIEFTPEAGNDRTWFGRNIYTFTITAEITDLNGETRSGEYTLSVGDVSMILNVEMPAQIEKSKELKIEIGAKNLNGADIQTSGTYAIYTVDRNDSIQTKLTEGEFVKTGKQEELAEKIKTLPSGKLRIEIKSKDDGGKEVKTQSDFVLFSYNDQRPPYPTNIWIAEKTNVFKDDQPAEIVYGTSNTDAYILYHIYNNKKTFERRFVKLSNENQTFAIPYQAEFGDEVYAAFTSVRDGRIETRNVLLAKAEEPKDEKLNVKVNVFRDKLRPGQEETWTLNISDTLNRPATAEVLASMYDHSIDQISPFTAWTLERPYIYKEYLRQINYDSSQASVNRTYNLGLEYNPALLETADFHFDRFKRSLVSLKGDTILIQFNRYTGSIGTASKPKLAIRSSVADALQGKEEGIIMVQQEAEAPAPPSNAAADNAAGGAANNLAAPQIRSNFNETAFFSPQLRTNEQGETTISFTVPESNTTWRFRAFAHSKDSKVGELERMVVTQKELMVTPNMPRFVRQGDRTSISTKISNLSDGAVSGEAYIEFFNPINEKIVNLKVKDVKQKFSLEKEVSGSASWTFDVPADIDMLGVRIVAQSQSFSDGEQHALAVLPNRMLVTETMPVDVTGKGERIFSMDKLVDNQSKTLDNYRLTFEFASNPAWYAIQALPTMSNPTNENALNWFASYYVNTLGSSLMKQYPKVGNTIKVWLAQGGTKETLVSKLNKNEELKTIIQEETPWVLDAKNETEQMERLSLLFDLNNTGQLTAAALQKLEELQTSEGAFSWYKGMYANRAMTQYILFAFANLQRIGMVEYPENVKQMQINALKYVDNQIVKDFENLKKYNKEWESITTIGTYQLEYLYTRAMYRDIPIGKEAREAERFYTNVISKNWTGLNLYEKSLLSVLSKELGNKTLATSITQSIREHAVTDKEKGMYWPNNKNRVFLSMSAVCSHVFMMEALKVNGATAEEMNMMTRWLIKQKQTQVWENTNATIHAIATLLQEGSNWFTLDTDLPVIKVGKQTVKPENKELGTGYFKTSWTDSEIKPEMGKVSITAADSKPAFGALYWQYYEDMDKITQQDGALNINKELYKEVVSASGKTLEKITEDSPLKVGDKVIVRLVVRNDRDMEFVQLKDMRASCFEPVNTLSGIDWQNSVMFYHTTKDASTNFYFDVLPKGTYVFEYPVYVNRTGEYANGITSLQCAYAPEFTSHTAGIKVTVAE